MRKRSYVLQDNANLTTTRTRFDSESYAQIHINLWDVGPNGTSLNIPIGEPLPRECQIFQIRMTSDSPNCEFAVHTKPYDQCGLTDFVFKCLTDKVDELLQETWLVVQASYAVEPYLFFSFKELVGIDPGKIRLEMRITG